jgi:hypothetical protein
MRIVQVPYIAAMIRDSGPAMKPTLRSLLGAGALAALAGLPAAAFAQQQGYGQTLRGTTQERQVLDNGPTTGKAAPLINPANPLDLMNQIRRGNALNDATPPSSAIDQALSDFEGQRPATP